MGGIISLEALLLFLALIIGAGVVGLASFLVVRQMLDRLLEREGSNFEARVFDELEILRLRLDRISELLEGQHVAAPHPGSAVNGPLQRLPAAPGEEKDGG